MSTKGVNILQTSKAVESELGKINHSNAEFADETENIKYKKTVYNTV